jgi:hypothetical protein
MSAKIIHYAKRHAYLMCFSWNRGIDKEGHCTEYSKRKYESHTKYCKDIEDNESYYFGTPPKTRFKIFCNYLAHKLLEYAWENNLYIKKGSDYVFYLSYGYARQYF